MKKIFINLKRFEISRELGGVCPQDEPSAWIKDVITKTVKHHLGNKENLKIIYLLPEALIISARNKLAEFPQEQTKNIAIGSEGVFREDIKPGGNFGAFTSNLPATAAKNLGCTWSIIGHSEERKDKLGLLEAYDHNIAINPDLAIKARETLDRIINKEVINALNVDLNVLLCVGETAEERGKGGFSEQKPRIQEVLKNQFLYNLEGVKEILKNKELVIGYEPIWAIGPGKVPPGKEYIGFVSTFIKETVKEELGIKVEVVYGGGLKQENSGMLAKIPSLDGGLVALTSFTGEIGFAVSGLNGIVNEYLKNC